MDRVLLISMAFMTVLAGWVYAQDVQIELQMPTDMYGPGSLFYLVLNIDNSGSEMPKASVFVALTVGTGDYWFYPTWVKYPPDLDFEQYHFYQDHEFDLLILPEFYWPSGAGAFNGAMFIAAVVNNGELVSNIADITFGWSGNPQPTPTPGVTPPAAVYIPPGTYNRGNLEDEICSSVEYHQVTLTRGIEMMQTEVTRQMWADLKAAMPALPPDPSDIAYSPNQNYPVQNVGWREAILFANMMSVYYGHTRCYYVDEGFTDPVNATNYMSSYTSAIFYCNWDADGYRLPTEAEWEYACRAGTTGDFSCDVPTLTAETCMECTPGTHPVLEEHCFFCANNLGGPAIPGNKLPNPWQLYDMLGNVSEWCWDRYGSYPTESVTDPTGDTSSGHTHKRVYRGGYWLSEPAGCRSGLRNSMELDGISQFTGFRLCRKFF